jgi:3-hydroxymyristoyl/3-hydroxydecanoyl-(acyl carrier protein) dehydratase
MPVVSGPVLDPGTQSLTCLLRVPDDLPIFRGHFPAVPIVPGVMQVAWAVELARSCGLASGPLVAISTAKFRRVVRPGMCLTARVERGAAAGQLQFTYELAGAVVSTGRFCCGSDHD